MADLRPQHTEEAVGANHPTKTDVINRAYNVEHEEDGTHKDNVIVNDNLGPDCVDDTKIANIAVKKEHINTDIRGTGLAGGAGTALSVDGIVEVGASAELKVKVVEIGTWDMDAAASVNVAHGLTFADIRYVNVLIRDDTDVLYKPLDYGITDPYGSWEIDATNVICSRPLASGFNNAAYDTMGEDGNRGWITIWYVA